MVQLNRIPPHYISLEAALRSITVEDRISGSSQIQEPAAPATRFRPVPPVEQAARLVGADDPSVMLWGRCGYIPTSRATERPYEAPSPEPKSGS